MRIALFLSLALACAVCVCAQSAAPVGRTLYASFDGTLDADEAAGSPVAQPEGNPEFAEGRLGRGLVVGDLDGSTGVRYATARNFSFERGTVCMWVQPLNWRGDDDRHHLFFNLQAEGDTGLFSFYKYATTVWGLTFLIDPGGAPRGKTYLYRPITDWEPGRWHHIAASWCRNETAAIYIDGREVGRLRGSALIDRPPAETMRIGGDWQSDGGRTVIDEVMIFDRRLDPTEIARLAGVQLEEPGPRDARDLPNVLLIHAVLGQQIVARVLPTALGEPADAARVALRPVRADATVRQETVSLRPGAINTVSVDIARLAHGEYEARLELLRGGEVIGTEALSFSKETDDTWADAAQLGRRDYVLPPFEPLQVDGATLTCARRRYRLGGDGLLASAIAAGEELLAAPVRLVATGDAGEIALTRGDAPASTQENETTAHASGSASGGRVSVSSEVTARYDGTLWTRLEITPEQALSLHSLRIEVPLRPEHADYFQWAALKRVTGERGWYGALPEGEGQVWAEEFLPLVWLGSDARGLGWYAESDEHWDLGDGALTIERRPDATVLCMNIIREPREVTEPFAVEFGLQATPVRDLAPDWRACRWLPSSEITRFFLHLTENPYPRADLEGVEPHGKIAYLYTHHRYFTNTLPRDPREFREMFERVKQYGLLGTPYTEARFLPEDHGDVLLRGSEMLMEPCVRASGYGEHCAIGVCQNGPFADWLVWYIHHMIEEYGANGVYLDEMVPSVCTNAEHGCGYVAADGTRRPTYPVRSYLETYRRIREIFVDTGEPFWISYHLSGARLSPLPTFADDLLMAEDLYYDVRDNPDYTQIMTADRWIAGYYPDSWGIPSVILPQFKMNAQWMKDPDLAERFMASVVPHDLMVWPSFADAETIMAMRTPLTEFGIGEPDTRFIGHWQPDTGVACADGRAKVSAYIRPGRLMLCVANWSEDDIAGLAIDLDPAKLGLAPPFSARDARTGEPLEMAGTQVLAPAPAKRLRLIEVTGE